MRKALPITVLTAVLAFGAGACGNKTVTSAPPTTSASVQSSSNGAASDPTDGADAELTQVDQLVKDIEGDLSAVDQDAATPEGDPTQ
ncbi:MAG TPA: hypothetical protein VHC63_17415 [Acidimicrobiales bacterium]|nr:hypothetical protein [Acidimicrobiales bacterium]